MSRQYKTGKSNRTNYIYYGSDGEKIIIVPGESGVTEADIERLHTMDDEGVDAQRRYEYHTPERYDAFLLDEENSANSNPYLLDAEADPDAVFQAKEESERYQRLLKELSQAMKLLTPRQRRLFQQVYVEKRSYTEIAAQEGVTEGAVRHRMRKLHARLKKMMKKDQ